MTKSTPYRNISSHIVDKAISLDLSVYLKTVTLGVSRLQNVIAQTITSFQKIIAYGKGVTSTRCSDHKFGYTDFMRFSN